MNWADHNGYNFLSQYATREENDMDEQEKKIRELEQERQDSPWTGAEWQKTFGESLSNRPEPIPITAHVSASQDVLMVWAENLVQAKALKSMAEDALTKANEQITSAEEKLSEIMAERDMASFKTTDGRLFYKYVSSFPKIKNEAGFYEWLEQHGEAGIIKRTIHPQTLRAWYKDKSLEHGEELTDKLEVFEKIRIGVRT